VANSAASFPVAVSMTWALPAVVADTVNRVPSGDSTAWSDLNPAPLKRHSICLLLMSKATESLRLPRETYSVAPSGETYTSSAKRSPPSSLLTTSYAAFSTGFMPSSRS